MVVDELSCFADFIVALLLSQAIGSIYDIVRAIGIKNRRISDFIFSLISFYAILYVWIFMLGGSIRWYVVLTLVCGLIIYFLSLSRIIYPLLSNITKKTAKFYHIIFNLLLTAMRFLGKIVIYVKKAFCR